MKINKLTIQDLQGVAVQDKFWFVIMSPLVFGLFSLLTYLSLSYPSMSYDAESAFLYFAVVVVLTFCGQELLGWRTFSKRWLYLYKVHLHGETYHIIKDAARRVRVIHESQQQGSIDHTGSHKMLSDLRTSKVYRSPELSHWLRSERPVLGVIKGDDVVFD